MHRRTFLASTLALAGTARAQNLPAPALVRPPEQRWNIAVPVLDFAAPDTGKPCAPALQAALDAAFEAGLPLVFPRGEWIIEKPLAIRHVERRRRGCPHILGAGSGSTILRALPFAGPMLGVRGVPEAPPLGHFFLSGGGVEGIDFVGSGTRAPGQNGIETMGWWQGTLKNCGFYTLGGHGIRSAGDLSLDPNPDWTSSILRVEGCNFARLGGWGFLDDNPIGSPAWVFSHCVFNMCVGGGAFTRSSGHEYLGCSFGACGFVDEQTAGPGFGTGLRIGDPPGSAINRTRVIVAEFDSSKDAHVLVDRASSFLLEDCRFIHNDRFGTGTAVPPVAVQLGTDAARSQATGGRIIRALFRLDTPGPVTGFRCASVNRIRDVVIEPALWSVEYQGDSWLTKFEGFPEGEAAKRARVVIEEG